MNLQIGLELNHFDHINRESNSFERDEALEEAIYYSNTIGYSFLTLPVIDPAYENHFHPGGSLFDAHEALQPFSPNDLLVSSGEHGDVMLAKTSSWINLDSKNSLERLRAVEIFNHELAWIGHLGIHQVLVTPTSSHNYARMVLLALNALPYCTILVRIPVDDWQRWNSIRTACDHSPRLAIALDLHNVSEDFGQHWLAEPVKLVMLDSTNFVENPSGYPVLPKRVKAFAMDLMTICSQFSVKQSLDRSAIHPKGGPTCYKDYLVHINTARPGQDDIERFAAGYDDYLQMPLQPLMDNLDNGTYEVFEQDPIKYAQYEEAVRRALLDRPRDQTMYAYAIKLTPEKALQFWEQGEARWFIVVCWLPRLQNPTHMCMQWKRM
jgi:protein arginine N-methyltransferase 5